MRSNPTETENFFDNPRRVTRQASATRSPRPERRRRTQEEVRREKRAKFKQIMGPRVNKALHDISLLVHGSNRKRYYFTEGDVEVMRKALLTEVENAMAPYVTIRPEGSVEFD